MKKFSLIIVILISAFAASFFLDKKEEVVNQTSIPIENAEKEEIKITKKEIKETNFSGNTIQFSGVSPLAKVARNYVAITIADFELRANEEVPELKNQFGSNVAALEYSIELEGSYKEGPKTESIVISSYVYTGGANGMSFYKVFTASKRSGQVISITEAIEQSSQTDFVKLVQDALIVWRPEGVPEMVVFEEEVRNLSLSDMANWTLDDKNLTIYFDKYQVGPGALGAVAFPLPTKNIQAFLNVL